MSTDTYYDPNRRRLTIKVIGRFDFGEVRLFNNAINLITLKMKSIVIDLHNTHYMDSSALGMLLVLRKKTMNYQQSVKINKVKQPLIKTLSDAKFDKLFTIEVCSLLEF